jgi:hypothetical protein
MDLAEKNGGACPIKKARWESFSLFGFLGTDVKCERDLPLPLNVPVRFTYRIYM